MLDASETFDRAKYCKLFNELLNRNVSHLYILRLLSVLYTNETLQVKWKSITEAGFSGQGVVSLLLAVYTYGLLKCLSKTGVGCYLLMILYC